MTRSDRPPASQPGGGRSGHRPGGVSRPALTPGQLHRAGPLALPAEQAVIGATSPSAAGAAASSGGSSGEDSGRPLRTRTGELQGRAGTAAAASASELHRTYDGAATGGTTVNGIANGQANGHARAISETATPYMSVLTADAADAEAVDATATFAAAATAVAPEVQDGLRCGKAGGAGSGGVRVLPYLLSLSLSSGSAGGPGKGEVGGVSWNADGGGAPEGTRPGAAAFIQAYASELARVRRFTSGALEDLGRRLAHAADRLRIAARRAASAAAGGPEAAAATAAATELRALCGELRDECDEVGCRLVDLEAFERYNSAEFADIGLACDRTPTENAVFTAAATGPLAPGTCGSAGGPDSPLLEVETRRVYQTCVQEYLLGGLTYDMILVAMSDMYEAVRHVVGAQAGDCGSQPWVPPDQFKRSTTKYWVDPRDVLRVKATIVRHLPLLIFGRKSQLVIPTDLHSSVGGGSAPERLPAVANGRAPSPRATQPVVESASASPSLLPPATCTPLADGVRLTAPPSPPLTPSLPSPSTPSPSSPSSPPPPSPPPASLAELLGAPLLSSSKISSVYFDNRKLDVYHERLPVVESASASPSLLPPATCTPLADGVRLTAPPSPPLTPSLPSPSTPSPSSPSSPPPPSPPPASLAELLGAPLLSSSKISSVYFDNRKLDVYHERLVRGDGASLVRIRWYGAERPAPDKDVFVERKKHRDAWTGEWSLKERAAMPHRDVPAFLAGVCVAAMQPPPSPPPTHGSTAASTGPEPAPLSKAAKAAQLLREVQSSLLEREQEPYLRTEYRRSAFQLSHTNAVRISIDTHLVMTREAGAPRGPGDWCRDTQMAVHRDDVVQFPYAVLEIKLQDEDSCPAWALALRESGLLVEAPKFSKFLHGMALLYPDRLRNTPHWFLPEIPSHAGGGAAPDTAAAASGKAASGGAALAAAAGLAAAGAEVPRWLFPANIRPDQAIDIIPDPESDRGPGGIGTRDLDLLAPGPERARRGRAAKGPRAAAADERDVESGRIGMRQEVCEAGCRCAVQQHPRTAD
ncbi:hypothetical protein GPECTOR_77g28 [Gonium pectorale]|uniref:VTC domain-containing protein n=1 Tax=Gonium pectorale TaxID=33097 RepID=A0A150G293_GONPE|nr:hypothetical protein GPECTOR_77g28 [Gonium pectorale]|eukprot:KXZ43931.1 hypothetical protein GPECTOR_77g28 [Gonium pectorale]